MSNHFMIFGQKQDEQPYHADYWAQHSQGTVTPELMNYIQEGGQASVFFGTGVSMSKGLSIGVPYEYLLFRGVAVDVAKKMGIRTVIQDICDVLPQYSLDSLVANIEIAPDAVKQTIQRNAQKFLNFAENLAVDPELDHQVHLVSAFRAKIDLSEYQSLVHDARQAIHDYLLIEAQQEIQDNFENPTGVQLPNYRLSKELKAEVLNDKDPYLFEQTADMYLLRRDKNMLVKVGWARDNEKKLSKAGYEVGGRSELYFDYFYRVAEAALDKIYGVNLPPMGFIYTKPGVDYKGQTTSPYQGTAEKINLLFFDGPQIPAEEQWRKLQNSVETDKQIISYLVKLMGPEIVRQEAEGYIIKVVAAVQPANDNADLRVSVPYTDCKLT